MTILLPLTEGFLLARYLKHIEPPPEPETEKEDTLAGKVPKINQPPDELPEGQVAEEQENVPVNLENTEGESAENTGGTKPEQTAQKQADTAHPPFDNTDEMLQHLEESGIIVNETFNQMFSDTPLEIAPDLEKRIEENTAQQEIAGGLPEEIEENGNAFDLPDEDELLQRIAESAGKEAAVKPEFGSADAAPEDIAPVAVEVLGADFDFETLKKSTVEIKTVEIKSEPAEE